MRRRRRVSAAKDEEVMESVEGERRGDKGQRRPLEVKQDRRRRCWKDKFLQTRAERKQIKSLV